MNSSMFIYHLFDVADEINLDLVEALWASRNKIASRLRLEKVSTDSITFKDPPVLVELGSHEMDFANATYLAEVKARIFDLGVISLIINIDVPDDVTYEEYLDLTIAVDQMPDDSFKEYIDAVLETIEPACSQMRQSEFYEDFVVYYFRNKMPDWDFAPVLMKDRTKLSAETRQDTLSNRFSYGSDIAYLTWDSALIYDKTGSMDLPDLLEFANAQFLELRYYDDALNKAIDQTYTEIDAANKSSRSNRLITYRQIRNNLMELMADMSSLTSNIDNALQVTEDIFNARVYSRYMHLLRTSVWRENINNKINVIQRSYNLLNEEVLMHRFVTIGYLCACLLGIIALLCLYIAFKL
ncbi:hypothetical protein SDC9_32492 [bioreactor metagenome]|uniref:DUF155 domain-containing protein n=1 Tax=bioreactor metagenome TaxID=1076179 RepID=A0A644V591_9ZZZZ|nr:hypothetical protein [Acholeplasmataceae bacterium]